MEAITKQPYITHQQQNNHPDSYIKNCGLFMSENNNWLGASPDGVRNQVIQINLLDFLNKQQPLSVQTKYLKDACSSSTYCLEMDKMDKSQLKCRHDFYYHIQVNLLCR